MTRRQFPIRPCFAITSNKYQAQTLDKVDIADCHFFSHGQNYVAQSRVGNDASILIKTLVVAKEERVNIYTKNVVYPEVLVN